MSRSVASDTRRVAFMVAVVFGLTVAVPADVVRPAGEFPLTWLTNIFRPDGTWQVAPQ